MGCGGSKPSDGPDQARPRKGSYSPGKNNGKAGKTNGKTTPRTKVANGSSPRRDSGNTDKGFKRRLREKMKKATAGTDMEELERAMERCERHKVDDLGDYTKAKQRLEFLKLRRGLRDAIRRSHVGVLEKSIKDAEKSQFSGQLQNQIEAAHRKLQHLKELNEYRHDILNMEQTTISEIHSYQRPPACVHDVMAATFMLLGHPEPRLMDWADIQTLLCRVGRDSLIREIRDFDSATLDEHTTNRVHDILQPHDLHNIRQASNGAAAFYVWSSQICDKVGRDRAEEEERLRKEELEMKKKQEKEAKNGKNKNSRKPK